MTRRHFVPALLQTYRNLHPNAPDIALVAPDLKVPEIRDGRPRPGTRVRVGNPALYHVLFLPEDWKPTISYPLIVEYPANGPGPLTPRVPGIVTGGGTPDDAMLGYGLVGSRGFLWLSLPFVEGKKIATMWWGNVSETVDYCRRAVHSVCSEFGGDPRNVLLCGFSRGSIACNLIGLHDDSIAGLWRAFFCHSHYDGVHRWPYPGSDWDSALKRLQRLNGRPQFISHERSGDERGLLHIPRGRPKYVGSVEETRRYLASTEVSGEFTFDSLEYPNHTDIWILRPISLRSRVREWAQRVLA